MTFTYDPELEPTDDLAKIRVLTGDTNKKAALLTDEEIAFFVTRKTDFTLAAIDCCRAIIAKLARDYDRNNLGMSATRSQQITHYKDLIVELQADSGIVAEPALGGVTRTDRDALNADTDLIKPRFTREGFDIPGTRDDDFRTSND